MTLETNRLAVRPDSERRGGTDGRTSVRTERTDSKRDRPKKYKRRTFSDKPVNLHPVVEKKTQTSVDKKNLATLKFKPKIILGLLKNTYVNSTTFVQHLTYVKTQ